MIRKTLLASALPVALVAGGSLRAAAAAQPNDSPLRDSIDRLAAAWNAGNGVALAAEFWPDGSLINILGVVFADATAIAAVNNRILAGPFKGSNFGSVIRRVRFIGSEAAIVDTDVSVTNFIGLPPGAVATKPGLLLTRLTLVYAAHNGVWKIEAASNTAVLPGSYSPA